MKFDVSKVASVYSGRQGCCCGCRGKHTYASAHQEWATKNRGYAVKDDEVSDRTVKMMAKKVEAHFEAMSAEQFEEAKKSGMYCDDFASFDTDTRTYCVYFVH